MGRPIECFGYLRVSGKSQIDGDGFPRQEEAIRTYAAAHGYSIGKIFSEKGVCGEIETLERPAFLEMTAELLANGVKTVIVEKLDRLSRHLITQETCIQDFTKRGLTLLSADPAEFDLMASDPSRVLVRQVFGAIAQFDRSMVVAKLRAARMRQKAAGRRMEGQKPFGSRSGERAIIERLKALRAEGFAFEKIAAIMTAEGIPARHGQWHATSVKRVLSAVAPLKALDAAPAAPAPLTAVQTDVVSALVNLRVPPRDAERAVRAVPSDDFDTTFRSALQSVRSAA